MKVALSAVTGTPGGPRTYTLSLLRALVRRGGGDEYTLLCDQEVAGDEAGGVPQRRVPFGGRATRPFAEAIALPLLARSVRPDVFHGTKMTLPWGLSCARVVSVFDLAHLLFPETFTWAARVYLERSTQAAVRRADRVITISETTARDLTRLMGVPEERIDIAYCGIDERYFETRDPAEIAAMRARHGLPEQYVLYVGTIQPRKNVDVILDAVDRLAERGVDPPPLVLAGRAGWQCADLLARAEASPRVLHRGFVPHADLPLLYAGATVFLSPSSYEGFGLTVGEAMACGTAAIGGAGSATDEVVGDAGLLVPPRDAGALADALADLLSDDTARGRLAAAGRERVRRFNWDDTAETTSHSYRSALEARG